MGCGVVLTVIRAVVGQPSGDTAVIVVVPAVTPVTVAVLDVAAIIVATLVLLLLQVPPVIDDVNVIVVPVHAKVGPEITGRGFITTETLSGIVVAQPVPLSSVPTT
jgi:hypothetical protein